MIYVNVWSQWLYYRTNLVPSEESTQQSSKDKTNVVLTRLIFFYIPSFQYSNKSFSQIVGRAVGDTVAIRSSEKYVFSKNHKNLKKINVAGYFFETICSLKGYLFRKKGSVYSFDKKRTVSPAFSWKWLEDFQRA